MSIESINIPHLMHLAHLSSQDTATDALLKDIENIMNLVDELSAHPTNDVKPLFSPFDAMQRLRADVVTEADCVKELEAIAPLFEDGHYLVPKVIDEGK